MHCFSSLQRRANAGGRGGKVGGADETTITHSPPFFPFARPPLKPWCVPPAAAPPPLPPPPPIHHTHTHPPPPLPLPSPADRPADDEYALPPPDDASDVDSRAVSDADDEDDDARRGGDEEGSDGETEGEDLMENMDG